jgi:hypothetical protein
MRPTLSTALVFSLAVGYIPEPGRPVASDTDSFKFVVLGDSGTGKKQQYELAAQMAALRSRFDYRTVILLGNNVQGSERPQDFLNKFEAPYRPLLDQGVEFRAVLGNKDSREQRWYKLFNMTGKYYTFSPAPAVQCFALESTYVTPAQMEWLEEQLKQSTSAWKIAFFHHPLYSSGRRTGSSTALRNMLEPLFLKYNVSVVFSPHENFYERITPQQDITYFVVGSGGTVRQGDLDRSRGLTASGFDTDLAFLAGEVAGDVLTFQVISRVGQTVDSGRVLRRN